MYVHVRDTCCNYVCTCVHLLSTGIAYIKVLHNVSVAIMQRNTCLQCVYTCVHVCANMYTQYVNTCTQSMLQLCLRIGIAYNVRDSVQCTRYMYTQYQYARVNTVLRKTRVFVYKLPFANFQ